MLLRRKGVVLSTQLTDEAGRVRFEGFEVGGYYVHVGEHRRWVNITEDEELSYPLTISAKDAPAPG